MTAGGENLESRQVDVQSRGNPNLICVGILQTNLNSLICFFLNQLGYIYSVNLGLPVRLEANAYWKQAFTW